MKRALLLLLAACPSSDTKTVCMVDSDCGGDVCARDGECLPASEVWPVKVTWTIRGSAANASTCATSPSFYLQFDGQFQQDSFGYEPVPCEQGQFLVDKLPKRFVQVEIGENNRFLDAQPISAAGSASFDLYP
ncbi:MAG TPA: hypothetical protein VLT45_09525 [Kofleriaceae bacterium]|nr:hypothetical protein [Kofleriaceae bacterium]